MTQLEMAFHEKWIKGITLKLFIGFIISTFSIIGAGAWGVANYVQEVKQSIKDGNRENREFTKDEVSGLRVEMNAKFDTIKINQIFYNYNTKLEIQKVHVQRQHYATERKVNGHIVFSEVDR